MVVEETIGVHPEQAGHALVASPVITTASNPIMKLARAIIPQAISSSESEGARKNLISPPTASSAKLKAAGRTAAHGSIMMLLQ